MVKSRNNNNQIIITGGKGFIGSHLNKILQGESYDIKDGQDIRDEDRLLHFFHGKETVVHLAALISVSESIKHPGKYYSTNIAGTDIVVRTAIKAGCKNIIFASSAAVYNPGNPYGLSKLIGEQILNNYKNKIKIVNLRFFNVYGPDQNPEYAGVISKFLIAALQKKPLIIYGDGKQTRDFISVNDLTAIIKKILFNINDVESGDTIEVGTGKEISINQLAKIIANKFDLNILINKGKDFGIYNSKANISKLVNVIGNYKFRDLKKELEILFSLHNYPNHYQYA